MGLGFWCLGLGFRVSGVQEGVRGGGGGGGGFALVLVATVLCTRGFGMLLGLSTYGDFNNGATFKELP